MLTKHYVRLNPRLDFRDTSALIESFMKSRADYYGIQLEFCQQFPELTAGKHPDQIVVMSDITSPFSDYDELQSVLDAYRTIDWKELVIEGLIPGSSFVRILNGSSSLSSETRTFYSSMQSRFNLQINILKYKRLKVFLKLLQKIDALSTFSVEKFAQKLDERECFEVVLAYGEDLDLQEFSKCPICKSSQLQKMYSHDSQAFLGFVTKNSAPYTRCLNCEVLFLNPSPSSSDIPKIYDEFDHQDFKTSLNFPYADDTMRGAFISCLGLPKDCKTLDLGGGIGKFSQHLKIKFPNWSVTHSDFGIKQYPELEKLDIHTTALDFTQNDIGQGQYDLVTMWEVIEHVHALKLEYVFSNIGKSLKKGGRFVFSTPNFDSPLCKAFDFYSAAPPFHTFVFSETWLSRYFRNHAELEVEKIGYASDFFDDFTGWMDYASKTSPSLALRGFAEFSKALAGEGKVDKASLALRVKGSEVIYCLKKKL